MCSRYGFLIDCSLAMQAPHTLLTKKDLITDQEPRWCPGCGDYAILSTVQRVLPELGIPRENFVWVSGIGCSSRFPYYMETFGLHSIHGRALPIATGIRISNPALSVWVATGDGDSLSIGGNHLMHCLRRNVDLKILLFNNRIYGLTKGQYSPTSELGKVTKTSPAGAADQPIDPLTYALGCGATFVARTYDVAGDHLADVLRRAAHHRGTAFVEILQNCPVFNDGAFEPVTQRSTLLERQIRVANGAHLLYGASNSSGLVLNDSALSLESVDLARCPDLSARVLRFDETNRMHASLLLGLQGPFPVPMGVLHAVNRPTYEDILTSRRASVVHEGRGLETLFRSGATWWVQ
jgi:2-oxoglutarate/2-oxoacid ferredoxin oxidoreductase subunit beta